VPGGEERQDSIFNALKTLDGDSLVLIHDGVRPLFPADLVQRLVSGLNSFDGIIPGLPLSDTIKTVGPDGLAVTTVNRDNLWTVQTPQVFPLQGIKRAYEQASVDGFYATDDASLVERAGGTVRVIEGSRYNIKVTTREDLAMVESLLNSKETGLN
jgi:2-C-methyl-D-erythritol 4-phosphate cytidylyltransferase